jgi:hypothetical protein
MLGGVEDQDPRRAPGGFAVRGVDGEFAKRNELGMEGADIRRALRNKAVMENLLQRSGRAVPLLLFPKPFEMYSFLASVDGKPDTWISDDKLDNVKMFALTAKEQVSGYEFKTYVHSLDSSDIDFSFKLGQFIKDFQKENPLVSLHITLAGTCGGSHKAGRKLGQAFRVTKAIKFDRGAIRMENKTLKLDLDKTNMSLTSGSTNSSWGETILSCNHVVCMDPLDLADVLKLDKNECTLCDMETFEFFSTSYFMGVTQADCMRVVSDVFEEGSCRDVERLVRKNVNMVGILELLMQQFFEEARVRQYKNYAAPSVQLQQNHRFLMERVKQSINRLRSDLLKKYQEKGHPEFDLAEYMREKYGEGV